MADLDDELAALINQVGTAEVDRYRQAPFDAAQAQRHLEELGTDPNVTGLEAAPGIPPPSDPAAGRVEGASSDFVDLDDRHVGAVEDNVDESDMLILGDFVSGEVDELASQIDELASLRGDFLIDDDDEDDDTNTVQVDLPEEQVSSRPDREGRVRSSVKKLFRK